ncbi:ParB/RepB/Spo0J family partition protein [Flavobacterium sp. MXW15]|uniref:Probable chromosome-partitioning protein ParB n=1 Tax=Xanthomonas chitinilytica TaxID=2989819 RepID=A0ABT3JXN0_9XANT|nr:ParB/RepB/Spo0J family partition protein [Xanthomonas sp. H13-6]MCW4455873.1 ParB/RepB/Spo0J family partition protein [Flavobacterium sp. MXW15]MCW4473249.1 ParB/RepB/Spo0J family partition protein [Xanthomonas sp. H13-6]
MSISKPAGGKKRGLGRGLDALLGPKGAVTQVAAAAIAEPLPGEVLRKLPLDQLQPGKYQPRRDMDDTKLAELSESIKAQGVIQPILVRQLQGDRYEIVAGERRWRASRLAGLDEVPVVVRELEDRTVIAMALIENIQREDLNPLEEAEALQRLISEFTLTHAEAAQAVGRSRAAVSNLLRLLELPVAIRVLLESRRLEMGHARALLTLAPELASKLAQEAADQGWSVREVEHRAQQFAAGKVPGARKAKPAASTPQADIASLETELSESLGTKVAINHGRGGKGKLVIHYTDLDTLDGVLEKLRARRDA